MLIYLIDQFLFFLSPAQRGEVIYGIHFWGLVALILYVTLLGSQKVTELFLVYGLLVLFLFYRNNGCFLTRIEKHYRQKNETIVDGFVAFIGMPVNKETRYTATVGGFIIIYVMVLLFYLRHFFF